MESEIERLKLYNDCLERDIKKLKAKIKRLQQSKLDKFAMAAMSGFCASPHCVGNSSNEISKFAIEQAKSLLDALEKEGE